MSTPSRVLRRLRPLALAIVLLPGMLPGSGALAQTDDDAAQRAAREIQAARDRANAAADAFFQAESDLDQLADEVLRLEAEADQLVRDIEQLRTDVENVAINRFINSGSGGIPLFTNIQAPQDQVQADVFVDVLRNTSVDVIDQYDAAVSDLADTTAELEERRAEIENAKAVYVQLQEQANEEVERLREVEAQRLQDEAVRKALESQIAAERARLEEEARRDAEAAARAIPDPSAGIPTPTTPADPAADGGDGAAPPPAPTTPPVSTLPTNSGGSGGSSGGRTGTGGGGNSPRGIDSGGYYVDAIICPMPGSAYGDTWGAPRSGGRRHEGVDMLAPRGTPMYAVVSGVVRFGQNRLGGNAVSLVGDNGNRYYYAHLSAFEGANGRRVSQGELIGYNGDTGNATGVPHLHFEIHPGGGVAVNPTPSVRAAGC